MNAVAEMVVQTVIVTLHKNGVALSLPTLSAVVAEVQKQAAELSAAKPDETNPN